MAGVFHRLQGTVSKVPDGFGFFRRISTVTLFTDSWVGAKVGSGTLDVSAYVLDSCRYVLIGVMAQNGGGTCDQVVGIACGSLVDSDWDIIVHHNGATRSFSVDLAAHNEVMLLNSAQQFFYAYEGGDASGTTGKEVNVFLFGYFES